MKVLIPGVNWQGNFIQNIGSAFQKNGCEIEYCFFNLQKSILRSLKLNYILKINEYINKNDYICYNKIVENVAINFKPDLIFTFSAGSRLLPETLSKLKKKLNCRTATLIGDNPFDSSRDKYVPMSLQYYDYIFIGDNIWKQNIQNVASHSKLFSWYGGYNDDIFYPLKNEEIMDSDIEKFKCDLSFTGSNYGEGAEGAYRAGILNQLNDFDLKIWGYGNWPYRFEFFPNLRNAYKGDSLSYIDLKKLYNLSKINLNMPSPQIFTSFQPRVFEIAATKGFQIIDYRADLLKIFNETDIVTFKTIPELKEKIKYYIGHPLQRNEMALKLYNKVVNNYTWKNQVKIILEIIND